MLQGPDQAQNATDVTKRRKNPFDVTAWPLWLQVLAGLVLLALLVAFYVLALRRLKGRRRRAHAMTGPVPTRAAWVWRDLVAEAHSLGVAVPRGVTRREQAADIDAAVAASLAARTPAEGAQPPPVPPVATGRPGVAASEVAAMVDAVVFGPGEGDPERTAALHIESEAARATMRAGVGRWTRLRSDADPRPYLVRAETRGRRGRWWRRLRLPAPARRGAGPRTA